MMISYAQNAEDVLLNRLFPPDHRGFYIDIGANHPTLHSVTKHFYDRGWGGVNVEPSPHVYALLVEGRPRDVNLNLGLSDRAGSLAFFEATTSLGMSTFSPAFAEGLRRDGFPTRETTVPVTTLAEVCDRHARGEIDFLKIDVEAHEGPVIAGGDWRRHRPRVILVEATGETGWEAVLLAADYLFAAFDGLNRYYVRAEDRDLVPRLAAPANVLDDFITAEHANALAELRADRDLLRLHREDDRARVVQLEAFVAESRDRLAAVEGLGPASIALAHQVRAASRRFPRVAAALRTFWRAG